MGVNQLSISPDRYKLRRLSYIQRQQENNKPINDAYLEMYDKMIEDSDNRFASPKERENNLEWDLCTTGWMLIKVRESDSYAQNLYAALCNNEFQRQEVLPILKDQTWGCSWRYAGGIIADMREQGDYMDWYCSGIRGGTREEDLAKLSTEQLEKYHWYEKNFVGEGHITEEIQQDLLNLGWKAIDSNYT